MLGDIVPCLITDQHEVEAVERLGCYDSEGEGRRKSMKLTYVESVGIKKLEQHEKTVEFVDDDGVENQVVNVYPQVKYQSFEGFGGYGCSRLCVSAVGPGTEGKTPYDVFSSGSYELSESENPYGQL